MRITAARGSLVANEAVDWFVAHRAGALSEDERKAFVAWLRSAPDHIGEYLALTELADDLKDVLKVSSTNTAELLDSAARAEENGIVTVLRPANPTSGRSAKRSARFLGACASMRRFTRVAGLAAAGALMAVGVATWWRYDATRFSTGHAEQRSWRLPDGTLVHLNSSTRITISFDDKERRVFLAAGQAVFEVAKDHVHPFIVRAGAAAVRAVGTEFDVYRRSTGETVVSVVEGRVAVVDAKVRDEDILSAKPLFLEIGQQASVESGRATVSSRANGVGKTVAWLQNKVAFDHDTLAFAANELNRYNDLQIFAADGDAAALQISGTFGAYDAESFVRFLEHQSSVRVVREGKRISVTSVVPRQ